MKILEPTSQKDHMANEYFAAFALITGFCSRLTFPTVILGSTSDTDKDPVPVRRRNNERFAFVSLRVFGSKQFEESSVVFPCTAADEGARLTGYT